MKFNTSKYLSLCCNAPPLGNILDIQTNAKAVTTRSGRCSDCKDGSCFFTEAELDEELNEDRAYIKNLRETKFIKEHFVFAKIK